MICYFCSGFDKKRSFDGCLAEYLRKDIKKIDNLLFIAGSNAIIRTYEVQIPRFVNYFKNIEKVFKKIDCITINTLKDDAKNMVKNADVIIMLGGNPFEVRELSLDNDIVNDLKSFEGVIIGISAGAMNMSKYIIMTPCSEEFDKFDIRDGLDLCGISIFPHCNFKGVNFLDSYEWDGRVTKKKDLEFVANNYGEFYLLQDYCDDNDLVNASFIRVVDLNINFIRNNDGKLWMVNKDGINLVK